MALCLLAADHHEMKVHLRLFQIASRLFLVALEAAKVRGGGGLINRNTSGFVSVTLQGIFCGHFCKLCCKHFPGFHLFHLLSATNYH